MSKITINPIAQEFIKEANEQFNEIKKNCLTNNLEVLKAINNIENNLNCALYTGDNNACYKLAELYDFEFEKCPKPQNLDLPKKELRDEMVLIGRKLGIDECNKMNLIFNPPKSTNIVDMAIQTVQEYFSDKELTNNPQTKKNIMERYYQALDETSEKQHFYSIKKIMGVPLKLEDNKTLINDNCTPLNGNNKICVYDIGDDKKIHLELINNEVTPIGETA